MFYRTKDSLLYDWADFKYEEDCLEYKDLTVQEYEQDQDKYKIENGILISVENTTAYKKLNAEKTQKILVEYNYTLKEERAYNGVILKYENKELIFETKQESISSVVGSVAFMQDTDTANWKFWYNDMPYFVELTKNQLFALANFGRKMINDCFGVEGKLNEMVYNASVKELNTQSWVDKFKITAKEEMEKIQNTIEFVNLS